LESLSAIAPSSLGNDFETETVNQHRRLVGFACIFKAKQKSKPNKPTNWLKCRAEQKGKAKFFGATKKFHAYYTKQNKAKWCAPKKNEEKAKMVLRNS